MRGSERPLCGSGDAVKRGEGGRISEGALAVRGGIFSRDRPIRFPESPDEACESTARDAHPELQPVDPLIAGLRHFLRRRAGIRAECLGLYAARVAFKASVREGEIEERIALLESHRFQTKATFRVKDRYGRKK